MTGRAALRSSIPPSPWQRVPDRPGKRRGEPISREAIVAAAIRLLDADGLAALSMRRLAEELGAGAASLYWHVGSKDALLDLVFDELIGQGVDQLLSDGAEAPAPSRWREQLKEIAQAQRALSLRHPYLVRISVGRIPMGPNALRLSERVLAILLVGGLPPRIAVQGYLLLVAAVNGFTIDETGVADAHHTGTRPGDPVSSAEAGGMTRDYLASLPADQFPVLVSLADEFALTDRNERFEMLIDTFIEGLARWAATPVRPDESA